uniref:Uncharacterized protein n=1 Tax=Anguilla anguilla TaxID=7936 RepID=A0A0E9PEN3_ANGAN
MILSRIKIICNRPDHYSHTVGMEPSVDVCLDNIIFLI